MKNPFISLKTRFLIGHNSNNIMKLLPELNETTCIKCNICIRCAINLGPPPKYVSGSVDWLFACTEVTEAIIQVTDTYLH